MEKGQVTGGCVCGCLQRGEEAGIGTGQSEVIAWFEWARKQKIVIAMSGEVVYTPKGEAVELQDDDAAVSNY